MNILRRLLLALTQPHPCGDATCDDDHDERTNPLSSKAIPGVRRGTIGEKKRPPDRCVNTGLIRGPRRRTERRLMSMIPPAPVAVNSPFGRWS